MKINQVSSHVCSKETWRHGDGGVKHMDRVLFCGELSPEAAENNAAAAGG